MPHILVNGRALAKGPSGVRRYLTEILSRWESASGVRVLTPSVQGVAGHVWEQAALPVQAAGGALLWSPANTGPLGLPNQVVTIHDMRAFDMPETFPPGQGTWQRTLLRRLARTARGFITVSEFSRERILEWLEIADSRVEVIPNGVDHGRMRASDPKRVTATLEALGINSPYFLALPGAGQHKDIPMLASAWVAARLARRGYGLVIAGTCNRPAEDGDGVVWPGEIADEHLAALYSGAVAFLHPSRYEGFGLTVLEAMACGTPVAASRAGALPEVVGEAGLLLPPGGVQEWADALVELESNARLRQELGERGRRRAALYDWGETAGLTMDILRHAA